MAYNLEPRTIKENLLGLIGKNPHAEPRPANTREECFLADIAENGGGGGSSLPPYTSADKGKVLTVGEGSGSETIVVVPEQTVTVESGPVPLVGADASSFVVGNTGVMTVNGTDHNVTATDMDGAIVYGGQEIGFMIAYADGEVMCAGEPGTYTVSLTASVPSVEPKWEAAIIKLNFDDLAGRVTSSAGIVQNGIAKKIPAYFMHSGNSVFLGVQTIEGTTAYFGTEVTYQNQYGYIKNYMVTVVNGEVQTQTRQARFSLAGGE